MIGINLINDYGPTQSSEVDEFEDQRFSLLINLVSKHGNPHDEKAKEVEVQP